MGLIIPSFEGLLLHDSPRTIVIENGQPVKFGVCIECEASLMARNKNNFPPKHAVANNLLLGNFPDHIVTNEFMITCMVQLIPCLTTQLTPSRKTENYTLDIPIAHRIV